MTKGTKKFRSVMCVVLAFLLSVSSALLFICVSVRATAFNPSYVIEVSEGSDYSENLQSELKTEFISYGNACNVDESFFDGVFAEIITPAQIDLDTKASIESFYKDEAVDGVDTTQLEGKLLSALEDYAGTKGYKLDDDTVANLTNMASEMGDLYNAYVGMFSSSYFKTISNMLVRYSAILNYAIIGLAVFSLLAAVIVRLSYKKTKNYTRYYIYAGIGATLMLTIAPTAALIMRIGNRINVANQSLYGFASSFINYIFVGMLVAALVMAVLTACVGFVRNRAVKENR